MSKFQKYLWFFRGHAVFWIIFSSILTYHNLNLQEYFGLTISLSILLIDLGVWTWIEIKVIKILKENE